MSRIGPQRVGPASPGAAPAVEAGATAIDLSAAPDVDASGIFNAAGSTPSRLRVNKAVADHSDPAIWHLRELADGERVSMEFQHKGSQAAGKVWAGPGFVWSAGEYFPFINSQGGGNAQVGRYTAGAHTYEAIRTSEDTIFISFKRKGSTVQVRMGPVFDDASDNSFTPYEGVSQTEFAVSGTVHIAAAAAINDSSGGTVDVEYAGSFTVQ